VQSIRRWQVAALALPALLLTFAASPADAFFRPWLRPPAKGDVLEKLERDGRFTVLLQALEATGLDEALAGEGPFTVFAPRDSAFQPLIEDGTLDELLNEPGLETLTDILLYHVAPDRFSVGRLLARRQVDTLLEQPVEASLRFHPRPGVFVNDEPVLRFNRRASNGIIHDLGGVLIPPEPPADLLTRLQEDGRFSILVTALEATGLDEALSGEGSFTVFAPTDAAFQPLVEDGTLDALLNEPGLETLEQILLYHVLPEEKALLELARERRATTLQGSDVHVFRFFWLVFVNFERVVDPDEDAANGVFHAIDGVLLPPEH